MRARFFLCTFFALICSTPLCKAQVQGATPKEALALRRITEYWKDGDYQTVKRQITHFLEQNPDSDLCDHLSAMLGDLYFQERNFQEALNIYNRIENYEIQVKTSFNRLQALFELRDYLLVIEEAEGRLHRDRGVDNQQLIKVRYLLAESCFRQALKCKEMDDKLHYLKLAKPHYKVLTQTKYSDRVLFPLAEIHRLLREDARAASLYLNLAQKYPEHRERFLFQAAVLQIKENADEAVKNFAKVHELGGKRSRLAAFNQMILLYQNERYEEYLGVYAKAIALMPQEKVPLLQFYEGRSQYFLGNYEQAILPLENFLEATEGRTKERKSAFLLLFNCSRYLKNLTLLDGTLNGFKKTFPKESELPSVLMVHAQMCKESGQMEKALEDLESLSENFPEYEQSDVVAYDHALICFQTQKWERARVGFTRFLEQFPNSERTVSAWRHLLNTCIEEVKHTAGGAKLEAKSTFISVLDQALQLDEVLSEKEKASYEMVRIKSLCELDRYGEAIPMLTAYLAGEVEPTSLAEAYLLLAICHQKVGSDVSYFIQNAEKALSFNPNLNESEGLHLELYNAYLSEGLDAEYSDNTDHYFHFAAEHLFASNAWKKRETKLQNHLWMLNHYSQRAKSGEKETFEKARILFYDLAGLKQGGKGALNITPENLYIEPEVLKFAQLLEIHQKSSARVLLLEKLIHQQEEHPEYAWKHRRRALLELAKAYESSGQNEHATNSYNFLLHSNETHLSSVVAATAQLHLAKLNFKQIPSQERKKDNKEIVAVLHRLKDLQIQKKLPAEPIHLEAALTYAEIRTQLSNEESQNKNALFFYRRLQSDFLSQEDPIGEAYTSLRRENPEKNNIFVAYMRYVDAVMLKHQALIAKKEGDLEKETRLIAEAAIAFEELLHEETSLKPYLYDRVKKEQRLLGNRIGS